MRHCVENAKSDNQLFLYDSTSSANAVAHPLFVITFYLAVPLLNLIFNIDRYSLVFDLS